MNPASEYVTNLEGTSPIHQFVSDHGKGVSRQDIEHGTVAGRQIALSVDITVEERALIKDAIRATTRSEKGCFINSLELWEFDNRFEYAEGFAGIADLNLEGTEHAWCMLDGEKLVDATTQFDFYYGVVISDPDILDRYTGSNLTGSGIIGNRENGYEFLRDRGYIDPR